MRIDKLITTGGFGSRKDARQWVKNKQLQVKQVVVKTTKQQVDPEQDEIRLAGKVLTYQPLVYFMLNKPQGVITATEDAKQRTVLDLIAVADQRTDLAPVGRLDKDTTGLLLLTNDGPLAHRLLSPKSHVAKWYQAEIDGIVTAEDQTCFAAGITTQHGTVFQPATLKILSVDAIQKRSIIQVQLHEGQYHEVKRLFRAVGKTVLYLQRLSMGTLTLPVELPVGQYRALTAEEIRALQQV